MHRLLIRPVSSLALTTVYLALLIFTFLSVFFGMAFIAKTADNSVIYSLVILPILTAL